MTRRNEVFGIMGDYVRSLEAIRCGKDARNKFRIFLNRLLYASYPVNFAFYRALGRPLFEPSNLVHGYKCRYGNLVFVCPGGNAEIQFLSHFEPSVKQIVSQFHSGDAVDVGASFGLYTVMLSKCLTDHGNVLSIEPDRSYYRFLAENVALNRCRNVIPLNVGAWSTPSKLRLTQHVFGGPIEDSRSEQTEGVIDAMPLDQIFSQYRIEPGLVKIDVEGAEYEVLRGMETTLRSVGPNVIFEALNNHALTRCSSFLEKWNYRVRPLPDGNFLAVSRNQTDEKRSSPNGS